MTTANAVESARELARDTTTPPFNWVEAQLREDVARGKRQRYVTQDAEPPRVRIRTLLREDVAGGKRSRSATQDEEEPPRGRTRTLPPISLEERARAQGEKRKRAVGLSHPLPTAAAKASALRQAAVDGRSRRRSGV